MNVIRVGMADLNVATAPDSLRTTGLGSCVGIALYDPKAQVAGLAHIMLPATANEVEAKYLPKYANTAVPLLLEMMQKRGADRRRIICTGVFQKSRK